MFCECGLSDTIYHASAKAKSGNLLSTSEKQMKNARVSACRRAHSFLLSATKCLESLLRKEELAGLEDFKRSLPTSVILWLQAAIASSHGGSWITQCSGAKKDNLNLTMISGSLLSF